MNLMAQVIVYFCLIRLLEQVKSVKGKIATPANGIGMFCSFKARRIARHNPPPSDPSAVKKLSDLKPVSRCH
jgi:hypothetical protein